MAFPIFVRAISAGSQAWEEKATAPLTVCQRYDSGVKLALIPFYGSARIRGTCRNWRTDGSAKQKSSCKKRVVKAKKLSKEALRLLDENAPEIAWRSITAPSRSCAQRKLLVDLGKETWTRGSHQHEPLRSLALNWLRTGVAGRGL